MPPGMQMPPGMMEQMMGGQMGGGQMNIPPGMLNMNGGGNMPSSD